MNKKTIAILILAVLLLTAVIAIYINKTQNKSNPPVNPDQSKAISFPVNTIQETNKLTDIKLDPVEINEKFQNFVKKEPLSFESSAISNSENQTIPLNSLYSTLNFQLPSSLEKVANSNDYLFFSCPAKDNEKEYGFYFSVSSSEADSINYMRSWEKTMLKDAHSILFPNINFGQSYLDNPLIFKDGASRFSEIILPDNSKKSINYQVVNQSIFISSSLNCLKSGTDILFDP